MTALAIKKATYDDLLKLPENVVGEIIAGELIVSPRPAIKYARAASVLGATLFGGFDGGTTGPGGLVFLGQPETRLGEHVIVPDIAGWKRERFTPPAKAAFIEITPDWILEVLSPSTGRTDRMLKMPRYAEFGVSHLWLVDPILKTLEVFKLENKGWRLLAVHGENEIVRAEPFEAMEITLATLWWD